MGSRRYHVNVYRVPQGPEEPFPGEPLGMIPVLAIDAAWATYFAMKLLTDGGWADRETGRVDSAGLNIFVREAP